MAALTCTLQRAISLEIMNTIVCACVVPNIFLRWCLYRYRWDGERQTWRAFCQSVFPKIPCWRSQLRHYYIKTSIHDQYCSGIWTLHLLACFWNRLLCKCSRFRALRGNPRPYCAISVHAANKKESKKRGRWWWWLDFKWWVPCPEGWVRAYVMARVCVCTYIHLSARSFRAD